MESEKPAQELDYPTNLDVVVWQENHYQVAATVRTNLQETDMFLLNELKENAPTFRLIGAKFERYSFSKDLPKDGYIRRKDEGVRVTGELIGGEKYQVGKQKMKA